ncbi:MAG: M14 family zinc carboxypeptidase [Candidatus Bathyarchaeales archaeon]
MEVTPVSAGRSVALYTPKNQMIAQWMALCDAHPEWASYESIGKSIQGNDIWLFKIGTPTGGKIMYDGQCHGSEDGGTEILYKFCKWLLESNDPLANHILRYNYHLIIPILNVDSTARQNMRREYILENGTIIKVPYGVDLNRNGIYRWGETGSADPNNDYEYRGLYGGSEPETMALHNAMGKYRPDIYVNTHNGGEYMLHYANTPLEDKIKTLKTQYEQQYNITTPYPANRGGRGGFLSADAAGSWNASGWLWEITTWENLTPTLDEWLSKYYPRAFPVLLAFAEAVEKEPPPIPGTPPPPIIIPPTAPPETNNNTNQATNAVEHDIAITNMTLLSPQNIPQGEIVNVSITVCNNSTQTETFNLILYANNIQIATQQVTLQSKSTTTITILWNTTNFTEGNYTLSAYATPILNETSTANNTFELIGYQITSTNENTPKGSDATLTIEIAASALLIVAVLLLTLVPRLKRQTKVKKQW